MHGLSIATPFGPAAGPHTQLAQNVALSWLVGGRFIELKTVQVRDDLDIPRPCIDARTVGLNVEWSQELALEESLEEYVKSAMLVELMKAAGVSRGLHDTVFDMSVGYDLAGIRSARVGAFLDGMRDARSTVDRLRQEIPATWARYRDLPFPSRISESLTLSTFHGCPPDEIERIALHLMEVRGLHVVVKLNPTLLGREEGESILRDQLGYGSLVPPASAFEGDTRWEQAEGFVARLSERARSLGLGFGVKLTNTMVVENRQGFLPEAEQLAYLSGPPLHVLAVALARRFRRAFGDAVPLSFSGGTDAGNFADTVALGLRPITVCTDLLRAGGYGRAARYLPELRARMAAVGAAELDTFTLLAFGHAERTLRDLKLPPELEARCRGALARGGDLREAAGDAFERWLSAARVANTETYAARALTDPRYAAPRNATAPRKVGTRLALFDCLTCDKCIPVCPNDANFSLPVKAGIVPVERLVPAGTGFALERSGEVVVVKPRQITNLADACNACGHCDVMCPEEGGPYVVKARFFAGLDSFEDQPELDGMAFEPVPHASPVLHARFEGRRFRMQRQGDEVRFGGEGFDLVLDPARPAATARGEAAGPVDLHWLHVLRRYEEAVRVAGPATWVGAALECSGGLASGA